MFSACYVFIAVSNGIIEEVTFFDAEEKAIERLGIFQGTMTAGKNDAAAYGPFGLIANTKGFLDDEGRIEGTSPMVETEEDEPVYLIANPYSRLGFMVVSPDDPLGYKDPVEAVSELGQMRDEIGRHLKLYRVVQVEGALTDKAELEKYNDSIGAEGFDYDLVKEHLK